MDLHPDFETAIAELEPRGAVVGNVFGSKALKYDSKAFCCLRNNGMMAFKLGAGSPAFTEALALDGAHVFDPSERDRPFKDWVEIPGAHSKAWPRFAVAAFEAL